MREIKSQPTPVGRTFEQEQMERYIPVILASTGKILMTKVFKVNGVHNGMPKKMTCRICRDSRSLFRWALISEVFVNSYRGVNPQKPEYSGRRQTTGKKEG